MRNLRAVVCKEASKQTKCDNVIDAVRARTVLDCNTSDEIHVVDFVFLHFTIV